MAGELQAFYLNAVEHGSTPSDSEEEALENDDLESGANEETSIEQDETLVQDQLSDPEDFEAYRERHIRENQALLASLEIDRAGIAAPGAGSS